MGAAEEIRIFQQHRPIHRLMQSVAELAPKEAAELEADQSRLSALFENHTTAEEDEVFPKALGFYRQKVRS